jgi:hypothetical protein
MRLGLTSDAMPRTTLDIDATVLEELKRRRESEARSLGAIASELLAKALYAEVPDADDLSWTTAEMRPRVDLEDPEAVRRAMER